MVLWSGDVPHNAFTRIAVVDFGIEGKQVDIVHHHVVASEPV